MLFKKINLRLEADEYSAKEFMIHARKYAEQLKKGCSRRKEVVINITYDYMLNKEVVTITTDFDLRLRRIIIVRFSEKQLENAKRFIKSAIDIYAKEKEKRENEK